MISIAGRLGRIFESTGVDAVVLTNTTVQDSNFVYLAGFPMPQGIFEGAVIIAERKRATLLTSVLEYGVAKEQHPKEMRVIGVKTRAQILRDLRAHLRGKVIGINGAFLPYDSYNRIRKLAEPRRMVDVSKALALAREVKDRYEIEMIGIANNIVKKAFSEIESRFEVGMTERQVASAFNSLMTKYGADSPSFGTIVCFGKNAAVPHHVPGTDKLERNSFVLIDAGARYRNYCSDVTRTFIFRPDMRSGKYMRMMRMHDTVLGAQKAAFGLVREGAYADTIHKAAEGYINKANGGIYRGRFIHSLGHGIGIEVHDGRGFMPKQHYRLRENMVVSDEPGVYVNGFGGVRIEDDVLVQKGGARYL